MHARLCSMRASKKGFIPYVCTLRESDKEESGNMHQQLYPYHPVPWSFYMPTSPNYTPSAGKFEFRPRRVASLQQQQPTHSFEEDLLQCQLAWKLEETQRVIEQRRAVEKQHQVERDASHAQFHAQAASLQKLFQKAKLPSSVAHAFGSTSTRSSAERDVATTVIDVTTPPAPPPSTVSLLSSSHNHHRYLPRPHVAVAAAATSKPKSLRASFKTSTTAPKSLRWSSHNSHATKYAVSSSSSSTNTAASRQAWMQNRLKRR